MDMELSHLNATALGLLSKSNEDRIREIQTGTWIPYTRALEVLEHMDELFRYPRVDRMPHMLLVGSSNNGKTKILKRFLSQHPADPNPKGDFSIIPVVFVEAPSSPDIGDLYTRIFRAINHPFSSRATVKEKEGSLYRVLEKVQTKVLLIDEIQHLIAGGQSKQREFRNSIKGLGNELKISIVCAGIEDALNAFNTDLQLSNRFEPEILEKWKLDDEFAKLLATMERRTPLKNPSRLTSPELAQRILFMSEGILGEIDEVIKRSAILAIKNGTECITMDTLSKIRWTQPSKRKASRVF